MVDKRQQAISGALELGGNIDQINQGLISAGQEPLSDYETALINNNKYGMNVVQRFAQGARDFGAGLSTLGGAIGQYRDQPLFRDYVNRKVGNYLKDVATGNRRPYEDFANLILTPYGTTVERFTSDPVQGVKDVAIGAAVNPFDAALDLTTFVPKGALANVASKIDVPVVRDIRQAVLPTNREKEINKLLNFGTIETAPKRARVSKELEQISLSPNIEQSVRDLTYGTITPQSKDLTQRLKTFAEDINKQMIELGIDPSQAKKVSVGQYVLENLDPTRSKNIYLQNVQKAIDNPTLDNVKALGLNNPSELTSLVERGSKAFDEGRIFPISQRGIRGGYQQDLVDLTNAGRGLSTERTFGYATPEQVAKNLDRSYGQLYSEIETAKLAQNNLQELATKFGRGISPDEINKIAKSEVVISPTEFKEGVKTLFNTGKQSQLGKLVKGLERGASPNTLSKYANDLYVINKNDLRALANITNKYDPNTLSGKFITAFKPIIGAFKGSVLAKVPYIAGNRIGNWSLGAIGGADYLSAINPNNWKYIPDYLKSATSIHGLNPGFEASSLANTYKDITRNLKRGIEEARDVNLPVSERIAGAGQAIKSVQDYLARPLFQSESSAELIDRAAVYFNQAKKYGRTNNLTTQEVLDRALTDKELQKTLISNVNNVLGDYVGRNYYINPNMYELSSIAFPFHKVITTSKDVLINQLRDNPLRVQAFARIPSRFGNELERIETEVGYQPNDNDIRGGITINPTSVKTQPAEKLYNDYNPLIAPFETLQSIIGPRVRQDDATGVAGALSLVSGNLNPAIGLLNAMQGRDRYGNPVVGPNSYRVGNKIITLDNNGNVLEQPNPDWLGATLNYIGSNFMPGVTLYNQTLGPMLGHLTGKGFYRPTGRSVFGTVGKDFNIPYLMEGDISRQPIVGTEDPLRDLTWSQLGFKRRNVYYPYQQRLNNQDLGSALRRRVRQENLLRNRGY